MCVLYALGKGTKIRKSGGRVQIEKEGKKIRSVLLDAVETAVVSRVAEVSTPLLYELLARKRNLFYVDGHGHIVGQLSSGQSSLERLRCQMANFREENCRRSLIVTILDAKLQAQYRLLKYYARNKSDLEIAHLADEVRKYRRKIGSLTSPDELRGLEGIAARKYFEAFSLILDQERWPWEGRNRRPPRDPVNSLLSYGYAFLEREIRLAIAGSGLDGRVGFFHSNNGRKDSLVYDLMEPFRQSIIDRLVLKSLNREQYHPEDFSWDEESEGCMISAKARTRWIENYEAEMSRPCQEYEGLTPREWLRSWIHQFALSVYRNAKEVVG